MKKVLVVTYYWPPSGGGAGVHRWLGFVHHLCEMGYDVHVYTPENPDASIEDTSLMKRVHPKAKVIKRKIWEPYSVYKRFIGLKKDEKINTGFLREDKKAGMMENLAIWIRGNFFIPDARKFWIKPSVKFLSKYVRKEEIDVIISTGPPHSMHMIGLGVKKKTGIKWIADFRDPWTNIDFYDDLKLSASADRKHHKMESEVLKNADTTVVVGNSWTKEKEFLQSDHLATITNGFDGELVKNTERPKEFSIGHFGSFTPTRNPDVLWKVLKEISDENEAFRSDLKIELVGKVDVSVTQSIEAAGLTSSVNKVGQVAYEEAQKRMESCAVLLLIANNTPNSKGILTSKLFEYMRCSRPVLAIGLEESDLSDVMMDVYGRKAIEYHDHDGMKQEVLRLYTDYKSGKYSLESENAMKYHRSTLCKKMAKLIEQD